MIFGAVGANTFTDLAAVATEARKRAAIIRANADRWPGGTGEVSLVQARAQAGARAPALQVAQRFGAFATDVELAFTATPAFFDRATAMFREADALMAAVEVLSRTGSAAPTKPGETAGVISDVAHTLTFPSRELLRFEPDEPLPPPGTELPEGHTRPDFSTVAMVHWGPILGVAAFLGVGAAAVYWLRRRAR